MSVDELELTYLARTLPAGLKKCSSKTIIDVYFPADDPHPTLRLRASGDSYEITKKIPARGDDSSHMLEHTIALTREEWHDLTATGGKRVAKQRYYYPHNGLTAEIDIFTEALAGLVLIDFEFSDRARQMAFTPPDFCLADVTQEAIIAGGKLAGATYADIAPWLQRYNYTPLRLRDA